jgi:hypothetical protein
MDIPEFNFETKLVVSLKTSPEPAPNTGLKGKWDPGPLGVVLDLHPDLADQLAKAIEDYQDAQPR